MAKRSYNQYCSAARALDVVGDRWTLLLVRELLVGPKRYTDLLAGLQGIGTNRLAERLKQLEAHGLLGRRKLAPPAPASVYELSDRGLELEPVVVALARWGLPLLGKPGPEQAWRADWSILALQARFDAAAAGGVHETYQFRVDDFAFWARVADGEQETGLGEIEDPALTIEADETTFLALATGDLDLDEAAAAGSLAVTGDPAALARCTAIYPPPA